jgi:hypothetical protein
MSVLSNFSVDVNFWDLNPLMRVPDSFASLYKKDKSKSKGESSRIMWAIAMLVDTSEHNKFSNLNEEDRTLLIKTDYLGDENFNFDLYKEQIDQYTCLHMSKLEAELRRQELKLEERAKFINDTEYNLENGEKLDKFLLNTSKLYDQIDVLKDKIRLERDSGTTRGGRIESASEKGLI